MSTTPAVDSVWRDKTVAGADSRRLVRVHLAETDGFVEGIGWWQVLDGGQWLDTPATARKTRVRTRLFLQRYEEIQP